MNAFITGSQCYGWPKEKSDVDLVLLVDNATFLILQGHAEVDDDVHAGGYPTEVTASLRFGKLNLIVTTDPTVFAAWRLGTERCQMMATTKGWLNGESGLTQAHPATMANGYITRNEAKDIIRPLLEGLNQ